jgi:uncharacterized membrane protein HdeD (DUF308 family)
MFSIPQATYLSLVLFFSASFLVFGIMELVFAIQNKDNLDNWGWYLVGALLDLFVGIILFFQPQVAFVALPYFVGFSLMFRSVQGIGFAFDLKSYGVLQWGNLALISFLGLIGSVILILNPVLANFSGCYNSCGIYFFRYLCNNSCIQSQKTEKLSKQNQQRVERQN